MPTVNVSSVKCACSDCVCIVAIENAIKDHDRLYCSDACAHHHDGEGEKVGCGHAGCACHS